MIKKLIITITMLLLLSTSIAFGYSTKLHTGRDIIEPGVSVTRVMEALGEPITKRYVGKDYSGKTNNGNFTATERVSEVWTYQIRNYYYHIHFSGGIVTLVDAEMVW